MSIRIIIGFIFSIAVCIYAAWKQMQMLATVSLIAALATLFKNQTKQVLDICFEMMKSTTTAKLGKLEFQISKELENISKSVAERVAWVHILLSKMSNEEIGLLLAISKVEKYPATEALKNNLRSLRAKGLIQHDKSSMSKSSEVWLSELGKEFAEVLNKAEIVNPKIE
jgi:hypothetical protein